VLQQTYAVQQHLPCQAGLRLTRESQ